MFTLRRIISYRTLGRNMNFTRRFQRSKPVFTPDDPLQKTNSRFDLRQDEEVEAKKEEHQRDKKRSTKKRIKKSNKIKKQATKG